MSYTVSSGEVSTGIILENGSMTVLDGGTADSTTVNSGGYLYVSSGGTVNSTTVMDYWGHLHVSSGGTANNTTVTSHGDMYVSSGGTAKNTTVKSWGELYVSSGGTATDTTMGSGASMYIVGTASNTTVGSGASMYIVGTASNTTVNFYGWLKVFGTADSTTVNPGARLLVASGGTANNTTVNSGGLTVSSGGTANSTTVNFGGLTVSSGGTANSIMLNSGTLYVWSGGTLNNTTMNSNSYLHISSGGTANNTTVNSNRGYMVVCGGGTANNTTVNSGGRLFISSGGTATNVVWTPCVGDVSIDNGAYVTYASSYSGVYYGSGNRLLSHTAGMSGINLSCSNDPFADNYTDMCMYVMSGGTAKGIKVHEGGFLYVSGGAVTAAIVGRLGNFYIQDGGTAKGTTMKGDGWMYVYDGGTATDTVMNAGWLDVSSGGTAKNTTVNSGALCVSSGGRITGELTIAKGGDVSAGQGAEIDFDLKKRSAAAKALVNDLSLVNGSPTYTVSVAADQAAGKYRLAGGASALAGKTLSIRIGSGAAQSIKVDGAALTSAGVRYTLALAKGDLTLQVGGGSSPEPGKPDPEPGTPDPPANLAAQIKKYSIAYSWGKVAAEKGVKVSYQIKVDGELQPKPVTSVKFSLKNASIGKHTFAVQAVLTARDGVVSYSAWSNASAEVADVTAPKLGKLTASVNGYTGTILLDAADNVAVDHYAVTLEGVTKNVSGNKTSVNFDNLAVGKLTATVQAFDASGNASKIKKVKLTVKDITPSGDVKAPKLGKLTASVNGYTATISLAATDNVAVDHYLVTLNGDTRNVTASSVSFTGLPLGKLTASVQAFDAAGNASKIKKVKLTVKDVTAPGTVTQFNPVFVLKGKATLSWNDAADNSGLPVSYEVELDGGKILKSKKTTCSVKLADGDHTYRVRAIDKAKNVGAWSNVQEFSLNANSVTIVSDLSYCDALRLDAAIQAATDASSLTASAVKEKAYLAAL